MQMRTNILFTICLLFAHASFSQSRNKLSAGISVSPIITSAFTGSSSGSVASGLGNATFKQVADSFSRDETYRFSYGAHAWINYMINSKWTLQTGLGFSDIGFRRIQDNPKFNQKIHPGIGRGIIEDLTDNSKRIEYNYRYQYLQVPIIFNYYLKQNADYKWIYEASAGIGLNVLLNHKITADLHGFSVDNQESFDIDSTGYEGSALGMNFFLGFKAEYRYEKKMNLFIQPLIGIFPFSVSNTEMRVWPYFIAVNFGINYVINDNN